MNDNTRNDYDKNNPDRNPDLITGAPGSHPVGTGVGAAGAGAAGAAIGSVAGPIGTAVGAVVGAVAGGLAGKGVAEAVNPTEDAYWRDNYRTRSYARPGADYDEFEPAYRYGYNASDRYQGQNFDDIEGELRRDWESKRGNSSLDWDAARPACRDAFDRVRQSNSSMSSSSSQLNSGTTR
jgi:hypothetical protein